MARKVKTQSVADLIAAKDAFEKQMADEAAALKAKQKAAREQLELAIKRQADIEAARQREQDEHVATKIGKFALSEGLVALGLSDADYKSAIRQLVDLLTTVTPVVVAEAVEEVAIPVLATAGADDVAG